MPTYTAATVPAHLRVYLPNEIAGQLVEEGIAVRPLGTRGAGVSETIRVAVDVINTGSALVSIGVGTVALKRLAEAIFAGRRGTNPEELTISITVGGEEQSLRLNRAAPGAVDEAFDFFVAALDVG